MYGLEYTSYVLSVIFKRENSRTNPQPWGLRDFRDNFQGLGITVSPIGLDRGITQKFVLDRGMKVLQFAVTVYENEHGSFVRVSELFGKVNTTISYDGSARNRTICENS